MMRRGDVVRTTSDLRTSRMPWARPVVLAGTNGVVVGDETRLSRPIVRFDTGRQLEVHSRSLQVVAPAVRPKSLLPW